MQPLRHSQRQRPADATDRSDAQRPIRGLGEHEAEAEGARECDIQHHRHNDQDGQCSEQVPEQAAWNRERINRTARKHGIGNANILAALANAGTPETDGDAFLYTGTDARGVELEMVVVPDDRYPGGWAVDPRHAHQLPEVNTMSKKFPEFGPNTEVIDDHTPVTLPDGTVLDDVAAEEYAAQVKANIRNRNLVPGGKSLNGDGTHSRAISVRLPDHLHKRLHERAVTEGVGDSMIIRAAVEAYLK